MPVLPDIHEKGVWPDFVRYDEYRKNISKKKKITLVQIFAPFADRSKSILPQRALFSHAGTHSMI